MTVKDSGPRLGRGLAALLGETAVQTAADAASVRQVPLDLLEPGPFQPRTTVDPASLAELAESIKARGILQPILARPHPAAPGRYQIVAGERRWRAAAMAGLHEAPVLLQTFADADALAVGLIENLQRQDLNALEEAEGYNRLLEEFNMTQEALAQAVGKSRSHINNTVRLLRLPPAVRAALAEGRVTAGHARALLTHPAPEQALQRVIAQDLSVRETEALTSRSAHERSSARPAPPDPDIAALQRELADQLGLRVEIGGGRTSGVVRIYFGSLDQLDGLIARLARVAGSAF